MARGDARRGGHGVGVLPRTPVPGPRLPPDLVQQLDAHRELAAELGFPPELLGLRPGLRDIPAGPLDIPPEARWIPPRRRSRLLRVEIPVLLGAALIAGTGLVVSTAVTAPQPQPVGCVQAAAGTGCLPVTPAAEVTPLYVDPTTAAARQVGEWAAEGRTEDAEALRAIADRPIPLWLAGAPDVTAVVADYVGRAAAAGAVPLLVAYNIPDRDCGSFSGGGAADADAYRAWVADVATGLEGSGSIVVLEPDAVPHQITGCAARGDGGGDDERFDLLGGAVDAFTAAGARVYIDAGNPGFTGDPAATAAALERSGVLRAAGFSLNVANFYTTEQSVEYGTAISEALGGAVHFVVDTSRNGAGRASQPADGSPEWCNPPDRLLGAEPTLDPGIPLVDGLLWIKRPGESDGSCRPGEPDAGGWFPDYALDLVTS